MEENGNEVLVKVTKNKQNTFERFSNKNDYKRFIAELIKDYKNTEMNVCAYSIHGLTRVIVSNKDNKIIVKYQEL